MLVRKVRVDDKVVDSSKAVKVNDVNGSDDPVPPEIEKSIHWFCRGLAKGMSQCDACERYCQKKGPRSTLEWAYDEEYYKTKKTGSDES